MRFFASLISVILGLGICACGGDDEPPPGQDAGQPPDGTPADAALPDGAPGDGSVPDGAPADGPGADAGGDHTPPMITETYPEDGATGESPTPFIIVDFDEPITASEPADALTLLDEAGQPVPGTVEISGLRLRFVPADDLALLGAYTAVVTTAVTDLAGNPLASEHRYQFAVRDGTWDIPGTLIEHNVGHLRSPDVAMDPRGNAAAVWSQLDPPYSIWANYYDADLQRWQTAQLLEHDDAGDAVEPRVAMDAAGNAVAVWQQFDGTRNHVWASSYEPGAGWDAPVQLDEGDTGGAFAPQIAMNAGGAAIVVWEQREGGDSQPWIRRYTADAGWAEAEPMLIFGQPAFIIEGEIEVAIDGQGDAMVIILADDFELQVVPHFAASGWGEPESLRRGPIEGPDIAVSPAGAALATWLHAQPSRVSAWRHTPGAASRIDLLMLLEEEDRGQLRAGDVAINPTGDGIALWFQDSPGPRQVWTGIYSASADVWSEPQSLLTSETLRPRVPEVAMDPRGHAHAIWIGSDGNAYEALAIARRVAPGGFGPTLLLENVENASLAVNAQGKAVIIRAVRSCDDGHLDLEALFFQ